MESKHIASLIIPRTRSQRISLHIEPVSNNSSPLTGDSSPPSPSSAVTNVSPSTPFVARPGSSGSETVDLDEEPTSGPKRSTSVSSGKSDKEKRKRSRVTPEQLVHLERFFSVDRSPIAARRREISELLGMQERQTQIWFQNRRAKAKLQEGKLGKGRTPEAATPDSPPGLVNGFESELNRLLHEDEAVTIIPCTDLSVGTWRRIATTAAKHDLIAYICEAKRCLTWFIQSGGHGFKMEIPFDTVVDTEFTNASPGSGLATFVLSEPPLFYLEHFTEGLPTRYWKRCTDWTEGFQATRVLRHNLIGSAVQLAHIVRSLHSSTGDADINLHSPSYKSESPVMTMELPAPPLVSVGANIQHRTPTPPAEERIKRASFGGPVRSEIWDGYVPPHSAPASTSFSQTFGRGMVAASPSYSFDGPYDHHMVAAQSQFCVPISRGGYYSTPVDYGHITYGISSSPPLLTTPYYPSSLDGHNVSGLTGIAYDEADQ
ncbi:hypothetical protein C8J56DRAFT_501355 [Mycena floridula]|nr:hypothetical protein C8J56DRAFT_501355 [Mycena floridula]